MVALACAVLLALPAVWGARRTYVEEWGARGRGPRQGVLQQAGVDLVLLVVAGLALSQLRRYGAPVTSDGGRRPGDRPADHDRTGAGAMLGLRLLPPASRLAERVTTRGAGFAPAVGARQVSRRPTRYSGPALLLTMTVAIGLLSLATGATWRASQEDQARHLAGADLRVAVPPGDGDRATSYSQLPGVTAVTPVHRGVTTIGTAEVTLLAADAARLDDVMLLRPDLSDVSLATLSSRLRAAGPVVPVVLTSDLPAVTKITIGSAVVPVRVVGVVDAMPGTPAGTLAARGSPLW